MLTEMTRSSITLWWLVSVISASEVSLRTKHVSVRKIADPSVLVTEGTFSYGSSVQCWKACVEDEKCFSTFFWRNERKCAINYSAYTDLLSSSNGPAEWMVLVDPLAYTYYDETGTWVALRTGSKSWPNGNQACIGEGAQLFKPSNAQRQALAVKLAANAGLSYVHIGVYVKLGLPPKWKYIDGSSVTYSQWADFEPKFLTFASLARRTQFQWVAADVLVAVGGWICERRSP